MKGRISAVVFLLLLMTACNAMPPPTAKRTAQTPGAALPGTPVATIGPLVTLSASPAGSPASAASLKPTNSPQGNASELDSLLPDKTGFQWQYQGFAEYAVTMTLKSIDKQENTRVYTAEGAVADMSGGEGQGDFSVRVIYKIIPGVLRQELEGGMAMDRTLPSIELLRQPLLKDAHWKQTVKDSTGRTVSLTCSITDIRQVNGRKVYFVYYKADGSDYYEKREITEGMGVTAYSKLFMYDAGREEIGYRLYTPEAMVDMTGWDQWLPRLDYEYTWFGLAEYGHKGMLTKVSASDTEFIYDFNGHYDDATGDSSRFTVRYRVDLLRGTVTEQVLSNERGKPEVNSKLHNLVVLKFPLGMHQRWSHKAALDGKTVTVRAEVIDYDESRGIVKVKYTAKEAAGYYGDTYVEIRTFEKGYGMTGFGNLLPGSIGITDEEAKHAETLQEAINQHMFGYSLNKSLIE